MSEAIDESLIVEPEVEPITWPGPQDPAPGARADAFCTATPGPSYTSVVLRRQPDWNEPKDRASTAARLAKLRIYSKLVCRNRAGNLETWFEVRIVDGSTRYVDAAVCPPSVAPALLPDSAGTDSTNPTWCVPSS